MIRKLLPPKLKLQLRLLQRRFSDRKNRMHLPLAVSTGTLTKSTEIVISQPIKRTTLYENKVHNLQLAADRIGQIVIQPGEVFSFWKIVGNPSESNGYRTGRNIVNGKLQEATGGGLCQLSGILYHTALLGGLKVIERYNHTVDIYQEEDRFTPLGADATVVYGYKDLRVQNHSGSPICFTCTIENGTITCQLKSSGSLIPKTLVFQRTESPESRSVITIDETGNPIAYSHYRIPT